MAISILILLIFAVAAPMAFRLLRGATHWLLAAVTAGVTVWLLSLYSQIGDVGALRESYNWVGSLGLTLTFFADGLGLLLAMLVTGIGTLIVIYAGGYLRGHPELGTFYSYLLLFMASMLGVALADNIVLLFVFWELTSISSYLLIGFEHDRAAARAAALQALFVTALGGLALLAGLILIGQIGGSLSLADLFAKGDEIRSHQLYPAILVLVLLGAFTKSAQFPFHFWLPNAMEAPSPVSAYLHSATMVKAGVFLLARLAPILGGTLGWQWTLIIVGGITMLTGAIIALASDRLKRILAYSTVSSLGVLTMLIGIGTPAAYQAAMLYLMAHAFYKGALFLLAGSISHVTAEYEADRIGGLAPKMPISAICGALAFLSMAGLPPSIGFVGKESLYETAIHGEQWRLAISGAVVLAHMLLFVVPLRVGLLPFYGRAQRTADQPHEVEPALWVGPLVLGIAGLTTGVLAAWFGATVIHPAVHAMIGPVSSEAPVKVSLWHGITPALGLSVLTVAVGVAIYFLRARILKLTRGLRMLATWGPGAAYDAALAGVNIVANAQTRVLQSGNLRWYLLIILATTIGLVGIQLNWTTAMIASADLHEIEPQEAVVSIIILLGAVSAVRTRTRLGAVASLGAVGYGVALMFVFFGAPDLAMTQFLIETLMVILFVLVLYHLPQFAVYSGRAARAIDTVVALAFGGLMCWMVLATSASQPASRVSEYFAEHSVAKGHGRNVVNVILVDFRAIDTLGEITVLSIAAIGVFALLKVRRARQEADS